jgi:PAS domain S-box-containing protein
VEDEALIALDLERRLQRAGHEVVGVADNADDALQLFREFQPDLVLMDIFIRPPLDGIETARAIGRLGDVPVVFLTAYADDDTLRRAAETSPYGYLLKPFDERTLIATLTVAIERHAADTRLRLLGSAVDSADVGIALVDARGERRDTTFCNAAYRTLVGLEDPAIVGQRPLLPTTDPQDPEVQRLEAAIDARSVAAGIVRSRRLDGQERWTSVTVSPVSNRAGQLTHLILFCTDISRERRTEDALAARERDYADLARLEAQLRERADELAASLEALRSTQHELVQREKLASLGVLVAGVAHEVNTPLGVAVTATSVAREALGTLDRLVNEKQVRRSELITQIGTVQTALGLSEGNLQRAAELIRHFKTVAVDQSSSTIRAFELSAYVQEVVASLGPMIRRSRLSVAVVQSEDVQVVTRPGSLSQILTNFVTNAITHAYGPDEPGELVFTVSRVGNQAVLVARDHGRGMDANVAARAFDPFFTTRSGTGGSGLGLFIVHNLVVEGLGGGIALDSAQGSGTTFTVTFPLELRHAPAN